MCFSGHDAQLITPTSSGLAGPLKLGQKAEIVLRSRLNERLTAYVAWIEVQSDPLNEERLVEIAFDTIPADIHFSEQAKVFIATGVLPPSGVRAAGCRNRG